MGIGVVVPWQLREGVSRQVRSEYFPSHDLVLTCALGFGWKSYVRSRICCQSRYFVRSLSDL